MNNSLRYDTGPGSSDHDGRDRGLITDVRISHRQRDELVAYARAIRQVSVASPGFGASSTCRLAVRQTRSRMLKFVPHLAAADRGGSRQAGRRAVEPCRGPRQVQSGHSGDRRPGRSAFPWSLDVPPRFGPSAACYDFPLYGVSPRGIPPRSSRSSTDAQRVVPRTVRAREADHGRSDRGARRRSGRQVYRRDLRAGTCLRGRGDRSP